jgi:hypothetical protein
MVVPFLMLAGCADENNQDQGAEIGADENAEQQSGPEWCHGAEHRVSRASIFLHVPAMSCIWVRRMIAYPFDLLSFSILPISTNGNMVDSS